MALTKVSTGVVDMSTSTGGLVIAKGTTAQQPTCTAAILGSIRENTTDNKVEVCTANNGTPGWQFLEEAGPSFIQLAIEYLVVAGGGAGGIDGGRGGGGGGGGVLTNYQATKVILTPGQVLTIQVGGGGPVSRTPNTGYSSSITTTGLSVSTTGGGAGGGGPLTGGNNRSGSNGGSGGGAIGYYSGGNPGQGISGQGFAGGDALTTGAYGAGGGGGAGQVGSPGSGGAGGDGGDGREVNIIGGTGNYYGGGGGGGGSPQPNGVGGLGGGGWNAAGRFGTNGLGGGTGGSGGGGNLYVGGSGTVIIRYTSFYNAPTVSNSSNLVITNSIDGTDRVMTYTTTSSYTTANATLTF